MKREIVCFACNKKTQPVLQHEAEKYGEPYEFELGALIEFAGCTRQLVCDDCGTPLLKDTKVVCRSFAAPGEPLTRWAQMYIRPLDSDEAFTLGIHEGRSRQ